MIQQIQLWGKILIITVNEECIKSEIQKCINYNFTPFFCTDVKNYIWSLERNMKWCDAWKKSVEQNGRRKTCLTSKCSSSLNTCR